MPKDLIACDLHTDPDCCLFTANPDEDLDPYYEYDEDDNVMERWRCRVCLTAEEKRRNARGICGSLRSRAG